MKIQRGEGGFTLIELGVVMALVAIMALFVAPAIGNWLDNFRIRQGAKDIVSNLQMAKMKAISTRLQHRVVFNVANETYQLWRNDGGWVTEGSELTVPRGVDIDNTNFTNDTVTFDPDGTSINGTIQIDNQEGKTFDIIVYYTGRIRIE